jgi:hypothetical protein
MPHLLLYRRHTLLNQHPCFIAPLTRLGTADFTKFADGVDVGFTVQLVGVLPNLLAGWPYKEPQPFGIVDFIRLGLGLCVTDFRIQ